MGVGWIVFEALCALFLVAMIAVSVYGFRKKRRFVYLQLVHSTSGKPVAGAAVYALRNSRSYQPTWLAGRGGPHQHAYEVVNAQYRKKIGQTDALGEFRHKVAWKATYGFSITLPGGGSRLVHVDHIARPGAYPACAVVVKA